MQEVMNLQIGQRGVLVLPEALSERYNLQPGDNVTVIDLDGVLILKPQRSEIESLANKIRDELLERGETLESMLQTLREIREERGREQNHADDPIK